MCIHGYAVGSLSGHNTHVIQMNIVIKIGIEEKKKFFLRSIVDRMCNRQTKTKYKKNKNLVKLGNYSFPKSGKNLCECKIISPIDMHKNNK